GNMIDCSRAMYGNNSRKSGECLKYVKKGNCNGCHDPHSSNFRLFLLDKEFTLCTACHKRHATFSHPIGVDAIDPRSKRDITCITCHALMASKHEYVLQFDGKKELCIQCHTSY
ncbi:MAG: hypothetical protein KKH45_06545, partial [Proteobacteria bacterium]|nr:hypothetical protein [Pseudomonadota bacterium]